MPAYILAIDQGTTSSRTELSAKLARQHGGKYVIRGKSASVVSGELLTKKVVILLEFPNMNQLNAFYTSDAYQKDCKPLREGTGIYDIGFFESPPPAAA